MAVPEIQYNNPLQGLLGGLQVGAQLRQIGQENQLMRLRQAAAGGDSKAENQLMYLDPNYATSKAQLAKYKSEGDEQKFKTAATQIGLTSQLLGSVTDQASYERARTQAQGYGIPIDGLPEQYDPAVIEQLQGQALTASQRLEQFAKERGYQFDREKFQYQQQNDSANRERVSADNAASRAVTMRGQDMADARARETAVTGRVPSGYTQNQDGSLSFIPGGPADPAAAKRAAPSEDERKAAGWLAQARNAYKNMQSAISEDPEASSVGFWEAYLPNDELANRSRSPARQRYFQAASSFSEAALRAATGAGVMKEEAQQKIRELTPQRGDSSETIKQKNDGLLVYLDSLEARAGRAALPDKQQAPQTSVDDLIKKYASP